jgi:hypothetical protein
MLVDHADTRGHRVARALEADQLVVNEDLAAIGVVQPVEDVHQGALAGAVLAEQSMDLTGADHQVNRIVGDQRAEALGDTA